MRVLKGVGTGNLRRISLRQIRYLGLLAADEIRSSRTMTDSCEFFSCKDTLGRELRLSQDLLIQWLEKESKSRGPEADA